MSPLSALLRSPRSVLLVTAFASVLPAPALAVTSIDQGPIAGAAPCSTFDEVETTCVLPFGSPATVPSVVTVLEVGDPTAEVHVARAADGKPGRWNLAPASRSETRWKQRHGTSGTATVFDVSIPLQPGDRVVLVDPMVVASETTTQDFNPTDGPEGPTLTEVSDGEPVEVTPVGRISIEPDVDADGWGDDTQDLCRGVAGASCAPATLKASINGPAYVPSQQDAVATWSVTNAGAESQPVIVNLFSAEPVVIASGPAGSICRPGQSASAIEAWGVKASALAPRMPNFPEMTYRAALSGRSDLPGSWNTCILPAIAPGATASGTIGGRGGSFNRAPFKVEAVPAVVTLTTRRASELTASAELLHTKVGQAVASWKASEVLPGKIKANGVWPVSFTCGGPEQAASCTGSIVAKAPVGGTVLGKSAAVSVKPGETAAVKVKFSKAGLKWLAKHRKSRIDLVVTSAWPAETPAVTTDRASQDLSKAMKRKLAALATPKKAKKR